MRKPHFRLIHPGAESDQSETILARSTILAFDALISGINPILAKSSKCPYLPGLTHWVNPGLPGLGFKPYFGKVGTTGE